MEQNDVNHELPPRSDAALQRALAAAQTAADNRAADIVVLDMRAQATMFDYFVLCTGTSRRQLHAISEEIDHTLEDRLGDKRMGIEGYQESRWILLDYGDLVIHIFDEETRDYYGLEHLWADAIRIDFTPRGGTGTGTGTTVQPPSDESGSAADPQA